MKFVCMDEIFGTLVKVNPLFFIRIKNPKSPKKRSRPSVFWKVECGFLR